VLVKANDVQDLHFPLNLKIKSARGYLDTHSHSNCNVMIYWLVL